MDNGHGSMALHVVRLTTNFKQDGFPDGRTFDLGQRTALFGPNGSGKSAVVHALLWALTGEVRGFAGRAVVKEARTIWRAKPKKAKTLFAEVTLSDGRVILRRQKRSNGAIDWNVDGIEVPKKSLAIATALVAGEVRDNLFGAPATAERWLDGVLDIPLAAILASALDGRPCAPCKGIGCDLCDEGTVKLDALTRATLEAAALNADTGATLVDSLRADARAANKEASVTDSVVEEIAHDVRIVTDGELEAATTKRDTLREGLWKARERQRNATALRGLADDMRAATAALAKLPPGEPNEGKKRKLVEDTMAVAEDAAALGLNRCPCCGGASSPEALRSRATGMQGLLLSMKAQSADAHERERLKIAMTGFQGRAQGLRASMPADDFAAVRAGTWEDPTMTWAASLAKAEAVLDDLRAARVGAQGPKMAMAQAEAHRARADALTAAANAVEHARAKLIASAVKTLTAGAKARFPTRFGKPVIKLRPKVVLGVDRDGAEGDPSEGEIAALVLALAGAVAERRADTGLSVLVLDDRGFDDATVADLREAFNQWDAGMLLLPVIANPPACEGWTDFNFWPTEGGTDDRHADHVTH